MTIQDGQLARATAVCDDSAISAYGMTVEALTRLNAHAAPRRAGSVRKPAVT